MGLQICPKPCVLLCGALWGKCHPQGCSFWALSLCATLFAAQTKTLLETVGIPEHVATIKQDPEQAVSLSISKQMWVGNPGYIVRDGPRQASTMKQVCAWGGRAGSGNVGCGRTGAHVPHGMLASMTPGRLQAECTLQGSFKTAAVWCLM
jgi:hypothetical protein